MIVGEGKQKVKLKQIFQPNVFSEGHSNWFQNVPQILLLG